MPSVEDHRKAVAAFKANRPAIEEAVGISAYIGGPDLRPVSELEEVLNLGVYIKAGGGGGTPDPDPDPDPDPPTPPPPTGKGIWVDVASLGAPPASLVNTANGNWGTPDVANQDGDWNTNILAAALVAAKTNNAGLKSKVASGLDAVVGKDAGARALALGRMVPAVVIAANLIGHHSAKFDGWLKGPVLTGSREGHGGGKNLEETALKSTNNWGTHARAAVAAIAVHTGDKALLDRVAKAHRRWLGENISHTMTWNSTNWHAGSPQAGINVPGAKISGNDVSGVQPEDQRRGGEFKWPVPAQNYVSGGLGGAIVADVILTRAGAVPAKHISNAIGRAAKFATLDGDDAWQRPVLKKLYGVDKGSGGGRGKVMAWTEYTHA